MHKPIFQHRKQEISDLSVLRNWKWINRLHVLVQPNLSNYELVEWTNSLTYELVELQTRQITNPSSSNLAYLTPLLTRALWLGLADPDPRALFDEFIRSMSL